MSHGGVDYRRNKRDRLLRDNAARISVKHVKLECGHELDGLPAVTTSPPSKPDLYFCSHGCGLKAGRRKSS